MPAALTAGVESLVEGVRIGDGWPGVGLLLTGGQLLHDDHQDRHPITRSIEIVLQGPAIADPSFRVVDEGDQGPAIGVRLIPLDINDQLFANLLLAKPGSRHLRFYDDSFCLQHEVDPGSCSRSFGGEVLGAHILEVGVQLGVNDRLQVILILDDKWRSLAVPVPKRLEEIREPAEEALDQLEVLTRLPGAPQRLKQLSQDLSLAEQMGLEITVVRMVPVREKIVRLLLVVERTLLRRRLEEFADP